MRGNLFFCSFHRSLATLVAIALSVSLASAALAQDARPAAQPRFAPGVLTVIPPDIDSGDTFSAHDIVEVRADATLDREPLVDTKSRTLYDMSKDVSFRRDVWCLELAFKPLRMLAVDIPQPSGKMQRKLVWYMVYRVRNTGAGYSPQEQEDGNYKNIEKPVEQIQFHPQFVLTSQDLDRQGKRVRKAYLDRILPAAVQAIQRRELPGGRLLNSAEMSEQILKPQIGRVVGGQWGVAIWEDVDPKIDFFSVYVGGLTNAYKWKDSMEAFQVGDPPGMGRKFTRKQLQLNFWRPGDAYAEEEREIRFGSAPNKARLYGTGEGVASRWIYR